MNKYIKEIIFKVANKLRANPMTIKLPSGEEALSINVLLPNGRRQNIFVIESKDNNYIRFLSIIKIFNDMNDLSNLLLETLLRLNFNITDGSFAIFDYTSQNGLTKSPAIVFVSSQYIKTANFEEINNKIILTAEYADQAENALSGGLDVF